MKRNFILLSILSCLFSNAQETTINDALRYSIEDLTGTARFRSMSGAFGAVGGDLSAINVNPAGSSIFNHNIASVSGSNFNTKNNSTYFGTKTSDDMSVLDLNQLGAAFVFEDQNSNWNKFTIALNYENMSNLDNRIFSAGTNPNNSIGNYFLNYAQGVPLEYLQTQSGETISGLYTYLGETGGLGFPAQQAFLGYQAYILEPDTNSPSNINYYTNVPNGSFSQKNSIRTSGYNGKFSFNFSSAYQDRLYIGLNLNAHFTDFVRYSNVFESNSNPLFTSGRTVEQIRFSNEIYTYGNGFSLNLGAIFKATEDFRVGLAYESPTWYRLNDELTQSISTQTTDGTTNFLTTVEPNVTNVYPTYKIQTPSKITLSGAYVINKTGIISADFGIKDYSKTKFKPSNDYDNLNKDLKKNLNSTYELRVGGEYKIKQVSLRAGYRFEKSPFEQDVAMGDLTGYSGGLGYNFGDSRLDLGYAYSHRNYNQYLISSGMNDTARIRAIQNNFTLTYSIYF